MGGPFGLANATDSKKKPTLIGRSYLPSASDASIQPLAKVGESKVESGLSVLNEVAISLSPRVLSCYRLTATNVSTDPAGTVVLGSTCAGQVTLICASDVVYPGVGGE